MIIKNKQSKTTNKQIKTKQVETMDLISINNYLFYFINFIHGVLSEEFNQFLLSCKPGIKDCLKKMSKNGKKWKKEIKED